MVNASYLHSKGQVSNFSRNTELFDEGFKALFAKLPTATVSFVVSVRPSVRPYTWNNSSVTKRI